MIRNALVVSPYGIGDLLFLTPVLRALKLLSGMEHVDLFLGSRTESVVRGNPHVDRIYVWDKDEYREKNTIQKMKWLLHMTRTLRANRYDLLLDYSNRPEYSVWAALLLGIPRRGGFRYKKGGLMLNCALPLVRGFEDRHVADYYAEAAEKAGVQVADRFFEFFVSEKDQQESRTLLQQHRLDSSRESYGVIAPGGGESWGKDAHFKRWPLPFFSDLISRQDFQSSVSAWIILGSAQEKIMGEKLKEISKARILNLAGVCSFPVAAAVLKGACCFVGNDGGLLHLARAARVPAAAFYGPVDPKVYGPYPDSPDAVALFKKNLECRPCYKHFRYRSECEHRNCLQQFGTEEALEQLTASNFFSRLKKDKVCS